MSLLRHDNATKSPNSGATLFHHDSNPASQTPSTKGSVKSSSTRRTNNFNNVYFTSAAAITESVLKRRWTATVLRHVAAGVTNPVAIANIEPSLPLTILNQRLRTLQRYGLLARFPSPNSHSPTEYNVTPIGRRIIHLLDEIAKVDRELDRLHLETRQGQRRHLS